MSVGWRGATWGRLLVVLLAAPMATVVSAEPGAVSRAVEVAPPKGWTPDTPLFSEEAGTEAPQRSTPGRRETGPAAKAGDRVSRSRAEASVARKAPRQATQAVDRRAAAVRDTREPKGASKPPRASLSPAATQRRASAKSSKVLQGTSVPSRPKSTAAVKRVESASKAGRSPVGRAAGRPGVAAAAKSPRAVDRASKVGRVAQPASTQKAKAAPARGARNRVAAQAPRPSARRSQATATSAVNPSSARKPTEAQGARPGKGSRGAERRGTGRQAAAGAKQR